MATKTRKSASKRKARKNKLSNTGVEKKITPKKMPSQKKSSPAWRFPDADVHLMLTPNFYAHVNSKAMAQASPVWKSFIFPPWRTDDQRKRDYEDNELPVEELDFTEDNENQQALLVLLNIAHQRTKDLALVIYGWRDLVKIAIMASKYICTEMVEPWVVNWGASIGYCYCHRPEDSSCHSEEALSMLLFGFVFRTNGLRFFELGAKWIYENTDKNKFQGVPEGSPLPDDIIDKIFEARTKVIDTILSPLLECFPHLEEQENEVCPDHQAECNQYSASKLRLALTKAGFDPTNKALKSEESCLFRSIQPLCESLMSDPFPSWMNHNETNIIRIARETIENRKSAIDQGWEELLESIRPGPAYVTVESLDRER